MPFQLLDEARGGHGHCGLGLAIAQRVASAHDGELRLDTGSDGGFRVTLTGRSLPAGSRA
jgi:two-component system osmolarity sensor histidine kinase EnvZ